MSATGSLHHVRRGAIEDFVTRLRARIALRIIDLGLWVRP